jgi:serine protease Do
MLRNIAQNYGVGTVLLVKWENGDRSGGIRAIGTAFICHSKAYLLTCAHIFKLTDKLGIVSQGPTNEFRPITQQRADVLGVEVAQFDSRNDVALLRLTGDASVGVPGKIFSNESSIQVGDSCAYLGYPFADRGLHVRHVAPATVSGKVVSTAGTRQYQLSASIHGGCSGGPLIDLRLGQVFGIVSGRFSPTGNGSGVMIGDYQLGSESSISFATSISYGLDLMRAEKLDV